MSNDNNDYIIRISPEEATSAHVDDMLKRQMSMRGDPGVTRSSGRRWFYQNWFVFMMVGMIGAIAAWAIMEPFFDDQLYFQGKIEEIDLEDDLIGQIRKEEDPMRFQDFARGWIAIRGQQVWILAGAKEKLADGSMKRLDRSALKVGDTVGVYVEYMQGVEQDLAFASFLVQSPPAQSPEREKKTLDQLQSRSTVVSLVLFPLVAGMIGLFIGAADGLICRLPRRALLSGIIGLLIGILGGFLSGLIANIAYAPLNQLAMKHWGSSGSAGAFAFGLQMVGRSLAWCLAGMAMGLGQGIALRSKRLLLYGFLGGIIGGLMGGLLFDPIDQFFVGADQLGAQWSRLISFGVIGLGVGASIGVVELLARDAWLRMTQGPLTGKEFLLFKDVMNIGSSPRSDIYLFNDPQVGENHAVIRGIGDGCEIEACQSDRPVFLNNRPMSRGRLRHGDQVMIGRTIFTFQKRKG